MGCLVTFAVLLAAIGGTAVLAWNAFGWWGLLIWAIAWYLVFLLLARFGPPVFIALNRSFFRKRAGRMSEAAVRVHQIELVQDYDPVQKILGEFDDWMQQWQDDGPVHLNIDEFLAHCEIDPELRHYHIEATVSPPADEPEVTWLPDYLSFVAEQNNDAGGEILEWQLIDEKARAFTPDLSGDPLRGDQRIRLLAELKPGGEYRFVYMFVNPLTTTVKVPVEQQPADPWRDLTVAFLDRAAGTPRLKSLSTNGLPVIDDDLQKIAGQQELEFLGLDGSRITDQGLKEIARFHNLKQLSIVGTEVSETGIQYLAGLSQLRRVDARNTRVTKSTSDQLTDVTVVCN